MLTRIKAYIIPALRRLRRLRQGDYKYKASLSYIARLCPKKKKKAREDWKIEGFAQAVKYLLCKHKVLSSNPSSTKRKKKKAKEKIDR
jgi:hypothetical protein